MTAAMISWGKGRRAAAAIGAVSLGLVTLSACEKPTDLATVTVGSTTVTAEATPGCNGDGKLLSKKQVETCITKNGGKTVTVQSGDKVRVGVAPEVAKSGWIVIGGGPVMREASHETYRSFDADTLFMQQNPQTGQTTYTRSVTLQVAELGKGQGPKTMWHFNLKQKD
ncbi:hypothetical protein OG422_18985 [Streptomyces sp. NBC_01525]|uniref:Lipoprotein n=1 Tax=Streptomyces benahoarensis TaxID=2595054 RepID=A0A553YZY0_9ACTN|nr:hypothetical protein [Streptomyces benahoarensis]TSB21500.1 hypothetical protein FNJ62_18330 [Streptomyces benahoarensis]TSB34752.1 hypothetical protein FNZ23_21875 [Streptomyces benahoarensis]